MISNDLKIGLKLFGFSKIAQHLPENNPGHIKPVNNLQTAVLQLSQKIAKDIVENEIINQGIENYKKVRGSL